MPQSTQLAQARPYCIKDAAKELFLAVWTTSHLQQQQIMQNFHLAKQIAIETKMC